MTEVINIRFRNTGKVYYFSPNGLSVEPGDYVIVETAKGIEYGECTAGNHMVDDTAIVPPLRPVIRVATEEDKQIAATNREKEAKAFEICQEKIEAHKLDMKLVDVEYSFEGNKILFFFTSDGRVDFRELVKDLVSVFRARIELRQIGVRDGAKMLGGLGICGRPFCCSTFLDDFHPVSIKMAKTQSLSLNPTKISGTCGRLMCCLKYEQAAYEDLVKSAPRVSASVVTPFGQGTVIEVNLLRQLVKVRVDEGDFTGMHNVPFNDIGKTVSSAPSEDELFSNDLAESEDIDFEVREEPRPAPSKPQAQAEKTKPASQPKPISELAAAKPADEDENAALQKKKHPRNRYHKKEKGAQVIDTPDPVEDEGEKQPKNKAAFYRKKRRKPKPPAGTQ